MQTVSRMLTVRRMFSLLHYRVILARKGPNVKDFFLPFSEYSAPGLGIVHSVQLWCRSADNWEFAGLFGQWCAVSMRYTALPPALVRGWYQSADWYRGECVTRISFTKKREE